MVQEASLIGVIKTLAYIIGFYYIFKFVGKIILRWLLPVLIKKAAQNGNTFHFEKHFGANFQQKKQEYQQNTQKTKKQESKKKTNLENLGDYVDYEEIK